MKDGKLKSKDFFDVKQNPLITFHSDKSCPDRSHDLGDSRNIYHSRGIEARDADFYYYWQGHRPGEMKGTMAFDRKDYGMNKGIPFVKIADRVEVTVDLKGKRVSGPPLVFKQ